ncbi:Rok-like winged helix domain-containing protein [Salinithrix halophila]|uniref:Repressor Rok winged helix domain-containing protein n=1 Tax=Salinithrix halophila TaxID=1485204 RepID=A0ABV8JB35_9BACL
MNDQLNEQLMEEIRALVREENQKLLRVLRSVREENTRFISTLSGGLDQALRHVTHGVPGEAFPEEEGLEEPAPVELVNTKGIHKKTIRAAELTVQILRERGTMRLSDIAEEVERRGGDFGSNSTLTMKTIMKIAPDIQKVKRGRFAYKPHLEEESEDQ